MGEAVGCGGARAGLNYVPSNTGALPRDGGGNHLPQHIVPGRPTQFLSYLAGVGDEDGRVAGTPRRRHATELAAGQSFHRVQYLGDGVAAAVATVEDIRVGTREKVIEHQQVCRH